MCLDNQKYVNISKEMGICMRKLKQLFLCFMIIITTLSIFTPIQAQEKRIVRVGYTDYKGFIEQQIDGSYIGYGAEYLAKISDYTNYEYEYVYGEWSQLLQMLQSHEIDLLCTAQKTKEREKKFVFSDYPIGYTMGVIYGRLNTDLAYEDFESFNGKTTGIIEGSAMMDLLEAYQRDNNFTLNLIEYQSENELEDALNKKEVDLIVSENLANHSSLTLLSTFGADAFYLISYKGNTILDDINKALKKIKTDVDFEVDLYHQYYDFSVANVTNAFTSEEKIYVRDAQVINVGVNIDRAPFSSYDENTRTYEGINIDILSKISQISGLRFRYVPMPTDKTTIELMESGNFDIICGVEADNFSTSNDFVTSSPYIVSNIVPVAKKSTTFDSTREMVVALPKSYQALMKKIALKYPNYRMRFYNTNIDCLNAVVSGEADMLIQNTHILSILLQKPEYEGLEILPTSITSEHTSILIPKAESTLQSILNKSISNIDEAYINESLIGHTFASPYRYTFKDLIYRLRYHFMVGLTLIFIIIFLLSSNIVYRHHNEKKLQMKNLQLKDAVTATEQANQAKSQFLSQMSHEIRTPMNAIVSLSDIAKHHLDEPDKVNDYLTKIDTSSHVLLDLLNDVLDMSSIENGKIKIEHAPFDIHVVIENISTIYSSQCEAKDIDFVVKDELKHCQFVGDSLRMNQILMNLVSNAYKFTNHGGQITITIHDTKINSQKEMVCMKVSDTGVGMSKEMQEHMFKPFEQEDASIARKYGGSGLGLSIVKNLVDLMNGTIEVESEKGKGTTFTVSLPLEVVQETTKKEENRNYDFSNHCVLLAEDNDLNAEIVEELLNYVHLDCVRAKDGKEVVEIFKTSKPNQFDLIFLDIQMPIYDGFEAARRIRDLERKDAKDIPIFAMSANTSSKDISNAINSGMNGHLDKPINVDKLYQTIAQVISKE